MQDRKPPKPTTERSNREPQEPLSVSIEGVEPGAEADAAFSGLLKAVLEMVRARRKRREAKLEKDRSDAA